MKLKLTFCFILLFLYLHNDNAFSQTTNLTGKVTDKVTGETLPGTSITVEGTTIGTTTNLDGNYSININSPNAKLTFKFLGYITQTVKFDRQTTLNVALLPNQSALDEVVVVGYGTQKKVNLTGAVSSIKGETFQERTFSNTSKAIQGLAPGVTVIDRGGAPGQDNAVINIRGVGTIGNSNPLILVDNVPVPSVNAVRPNDIESISVLKDAAAAAIYGSRAANGVILITTKRGKAGETTINYNGYLASQTTTRLPKSVGIKDYLDIINEGYTNAGLSPKYSDEYIKNTISGDDPIKYPSTDWLDVIFDPALQTNHALSFNGGNEKSRFALSLNYLDQNGIVKNTNAKNYGVRLNYDLNASKKLKFGTDLAYTKRKNTQPYNVGDVYWSLYSDLAPTVAPEYPDGTYGIGSGNRSPLGAINASGYQNANTDYIFLNLKGTYNLLEGLDLNANYSANLYNNSNKNHRNDYIFRDYYTKSQISRYNSYLYIQQGNDSETNARITLDYKKAFKKHEIGAILGAEQTIHKEDYINGSRSLFYSNDLQELSQGDATTRDNNSGTTDWALQSLFGRLNYAFDSKYLFEANFRYDGSSRFASGNRYGLFPSFSAGWRISEEGFMKSLTFLDNLKVRGSWGRLGNQDIGLYQYQQTIALQQNYNFGGQLVNGAAVNNLANQQITWETSTTSNFGLDADFLKGKLGFTAEVFNKKTDDILLSLDIPYTVGLNAPTQNAGSVNNKGLELSVYHKNQIKDFHYGINLNFTHIKNEVTNLAGTGPYITETSILKEGVSMYAVYGFQAIGLFRTQQELDTYPRFNNKTTLGSVKYKDQNDDGIINDMDKIVIGPSIPKYTFGANVDLGYKGVFMNFFLQGAGGNYIMPRGGIFDGPYWGSFITTDWLDRWSPSNPDGTFPSVYYQGSSANLQPSTFVAQNASYLRLKNLQLGYDLPQKFMGKVKISKARVYISGTNLATFTKAKYIDPELASGRFDSYPQTKMYSIGTDITF